MRNLFFVYLCMAGVSATAQSLQSGEKLTFKVNYRGDEYHFATKMRELTPELLFDYMLTSSSEICGSVRIGEKAMESAVEMRNGFSREYPHLDLTDAITVFPSKVMTDALDAGKALPNVSL